MKFHDLVKQELSDFEEATLDANQDYVKNQQSVIELIDLYWSDKFRESQENELGVKKVFYNIIENPSLVASKMIDIDTKHIRTLAEDDQSYYPAWLFGKELHLWMKNTKNDEGLTFGQFLNQCVYQLPKYGHILVKKVKDTPVLVPLQNIINKQDAKNFLDSPYLIEKHTYTPEQFKEIGIEKGWEMVEEVYDKIKERDTVDIYERFGKIDEYDENYFIFPEDLGEDYILHKSKKNKKDLYKELKWDDVPGRALGRGQVEKLFEAQIQMNKVVNFKTEGLEWTSKHLWQTRDDGVERNLMQRTKNGDVLIINSEVTPVQMEERNLSAYREEEDRLDKLVDRRTFSYDAVRGERAPAGTPLGSSMLQAQMAGGFFDLKREDFGMFIKDIIVDWILPSFKNKVKGKHNILLGEFDENELTQLHNALIIHYTNQNILKSIIKNGKIPDEKEYQILKGITINKIKSQKTLEIPASYYEDAQYKIQIDVVGESIDTNNKVNSILYLVGQIGSNPNILNDPITRGMIAEVMNLSGLRPTRLDTTTQTQDDIMANVVPFKPVAGSAPKFTPQAEQSKVSVPLNL